jgi:hypothetical protein
MRFLLIEPQAERCTTIERPDFAAALASAGLKAGEIDFGQATKHHGFVVYEHGLFQPPDGMHYAILCGRLVAGNVLVFGVGDEGVTVDVEPLPPFGSFPAVQFLHGSHEVELAIMLGYCARPAMTVNNEVIWQWPGPSPFADQRP